MPASSPPLPAGRVVNLPGRGSTFVREVPGPPGAPTVLLLHGWTVTADLNWYPSYEALGDHFRVLSFDQRGHGRGVRSLWPFRLEDCADDAAALIGAAGTGPVVAVGYSMGGPVAQLLWRRHPHLVRGLVMCATASRLMRDDIANRVSLAGLLGLSVAARLTPGVVNRAVAANLIARKLEGVSMRDWAAAELTPSDPVAVLEAGAALRLYDAGAWIGDIDVPTAVLVTSGDEVVSPRRQRALAEAVPGACCSEVAGGHTACVTNAEAFVPALVEAALVVGASGLPAAAS